MCSLWSTTILSVFILLHYAFYIKAHSYLASPLPLISKHTKHTTQGLSSVELWTSNEISEENLLVNTQ